MTTQAVVSVAVGVVRDQAGKILVTRRASHVHQGGLWEFPGGKQEAGETIRQALTRELAEEVGIQVQDAQPLIKIHHDYGDKRVLLDVWNVTRYQGEAFAQEGQGMRWLLPEALDEYTFPAANLPIIKAAQLPDSYAILEGKSAAEVLQNCQNILRRGVRLIQIRIRSLPHAEIAELLPVVLENCQAHQAKVLINSTLSVKCANTMGLHLTSQALMACTLRPEAYLWVAASCHNVDELKHAEKLGLDFAVLAPVQATATHPDAQPLGWQAVTAMLEQINMPVYLMGGLDYQHLSTALAAGAQGIAGIRAFSAD